MPHQPCCRDALGEALRFRWTVGPNRRIVRREPFTPLNEEGRRGCTRDALAREGPDDRPRSEEPPTWVILVSCCRLRYPRTPHLRRPVCARVERMVSSQDRTSSDPALSAVDRAVGRGVSAIRRWSLRVAPTEGESLVSVLERTADRFDASVSDLLAELGIGIPTTVQGLVSGLSEHQIDAIATATGIAPETIQTMMLDSLIGMGLVRDERAGDSGAEARWRLFARRRGSRFCPQCLEEDGGAWQLHHHLTWSFACVRHRVVLIDACPVCARPQRIGERRFHVVAPAHLCWQRRTDVGRKHATVSRCLGDLRTARTTTLNAGHPLLAAQEWINSVILAGSREPVRPVEVAGVTVTAVAALESVAALVRQIVGVGGVPLDNWVVHHGVAAPTRLLAQLELPETSRRSGIAELADIAGAAQTFGAHVAVALDVLRAPSIRSAAGTLERLADSVAFADGEDESLRARLERMNRQTRIPAPLVQAISLRAQGVTMTAAESVSFRTGGPIPLHPSVLISHAITTHHGDSIAAGTPTHLPAHFVPQVIWPSVQAILPRTTRQNTAAFGVASAMVLVRCGTFTRWKIVAARLEVPVTMIAGVRAQLARQRSAGTFDSYLSTLDQVLTVLIETPPPINYARRRHIFADLDTVGRRGFTRACRTAGLAVTDRRRRFAGLRLWELLTGGDIRTRPAHLSTRDPADRNAYGAFVLREATDLTAFFQWEAERLLLSHRIDEPVWWEPDFDPDTDQWRSPQDPPIRQLPGWTSPSRQTTLRKSSRFVTEIDDPVTALIHDDTVDLQSVHHVLGAVRDTGTLSRTTLAWPRDAHLASALTRSRWLRTNGYRWFLTACATDLLASLDALWGDLADRWEGILDDGENAPADSMGVVADAVDAGRMSERGA